MIDGFPFGPKRNRPQQGLQDLTGQHRASRESPHGELVVDDLGASDRNHDQLRDAAEKQRGGLVRLPSRDGGHRRFGHGFLKPFKAPLHLRLHRHNLDRVNPGQYLSDKVIFPIVLYRARVEYSAEFTSATYGKRSEPEK